MLGILPSRRKDNIESVFIFCFIDIKIQEVILFVVNTVDVVENSAKYKYQSKRVSAELETVSIA